MHLFTLLYFIYIMIQIVVAVVAYKHNVCVKDYIQDQDA